MGVLRGWVWCTEKVLGWWSWTDWWNGAPEHRTRQWSCVIVAIMREHSEELAATCTGRGQPNEETLTFLCNENNRDSSIEWPSGKHKKVLLIWIRSRYSAIFFHGTSTVLTQTLSMSCSLNHPAHHRTSTLALHPLLLRHLYSSSQSHQPLRWRFSQTAPYAACYPLCTTQQSHHPTSSPVTCPSARATCLLDRSGRGWNPDYGMLFVAPTWPYWPIPLWYRHWCHARGDTWRERWPVPIWGADSRHLRSEGCLTPFRGTLRWLRCQCVSCIRGWRDCWTSIIPTLCRGHGEAWYTIACTKFGFVRSMYENQGGHGTPKWHAHIWQVRLVRYRRLLALFLPWFSCWEAQEAVWSVIR